MLNVSKLAATELVDGFPCHVVKGDDWIGIEINLWIDKKSMLIRRYESRITDVVEGSKSVTSTMTYIKPIPNPKLRRQDFEFTPPKFKPVDLRLRKG